MRKVPDLGRPAKGGALRVLFSFDPRRQAILLLGGDKSSEWNDWYAWARRSTAPGFATTVSREQIDPIRHGLLLCVGQRRPPLDELIVSTLRQYLEALGARLELVAVFDDEDRRVPIHLGRDDAARLVPVSSL